jgi:hypothetical protein
MEANHEPLTEAERNAMRAYLQRAEVRLSTLHRVAIAFVSGSGLLILLPIFFKDEIVTLMHAYLAHSSDFAGRTGGVEIAAVIVLFGCLLYTFVLSLMIPLYSMFLLLKDVVHFYFTIYIPGFPSNLANPSFALSGIGFSPDEAPGAKREILEYQYSEVSSVNFAIPFSAEKRKVYFDQTIRNTQGAIIPETRRWEAIKDVMPPDTDRQTADRFSAAFGLARTLDRSLTEEVATSELSLVRHIIYLRRMVLRYVKALLMFIWTTIVSFVMLPFLEDGRVPFFLVVSIGYLVWALFVMRVARLPLGWIYRHLHAVPDEKQVDKQLVILESQIARFCRAAVVTSVIALALTLFLYLTP